jgi:hypothetical protein
MQADIEQELASCEETAAIRPNDIVTLRIFRQTQPGNWNDAIRHVADATEALREQQLRPDQPDTVALE